MPKPKMMAVHDLPLGECADSLYDAENAVRGLVALIDQVCEMKRPTGRRAVMDAHAVRLITEHAADKLEEVRLAFDPIFETLTGLRRGIEIPPKEKTDNG